MRKFKYCIIFFGVMCVSSLFAQDNYQDSRIFGTWQSVIFLKDIYSDIPTELTGVRAFMEITFAEDWSYYMTVNTASIEQKITKSLFGGGHSKRTYKGRSYDAMIVEGKYYFDGEKLYIDDSGSRNMYLQKNMTPDLWSNVSNDTFIDISWDVKGFVLKYHTLFPAIIATSMSTTTRTHIVPFADFHKVGR